MKPSDLRQYLEKYFRSAISLDEFKDWFIPAAWDLEPESDRPFFELIQQIKLRLAEFSNDHWNEIELRAHLMPPFLALLESPKPLTIYVDKTFGSTGSAGSKGLYTSTASCVHPEMA